MSLKTATKYLAVLLVTLMLVTSPFIGFVSFTQPVAAEGATSPECSEVNYNGSGTSDDPYQVSTLDQLQCIDDHDRDADYELVSDIDASETQEWNPVEDADGNIEYYAGFEPLADTSDDAFTGSFDGNGHTIDGLYIDRESENYVALFSSIGEDSMTTRVIEDVHFRNVDITGGDRVGTLSGGFVYADSTEIVRDVTVEGKLSAPSDGYSIGGVVGNSPEEMHNVHADVDVEGGQNVGGVVGRIDTIDDVREVTQSSAEGTVTGDENVGGFVGHARSLVSESYADVDVEGNDKVGGFAGSTAFDGEIEDSYATGSVHQVADEGDHVGGLVGDHSGEDIISSYAAAEVTVTNDGAEYVGGLVGEGHTSSDYESYWDTEVSGLDTDGLGGGEAKGLATDQMTGDDAPEYMESLDFTETWETQENDYPEFEWSALLVIAGEVVTDDGQIVSDATVEIYGVDSDVTDANPDSLLEDMSDPIPDSFDADFDVTDEFDSGSDVTYVATHEEEAWATGYDAADLSEPQVQYGSDDEVVISIWDASDTGWVQNDVDQELPGATVEDSETIELTKLGPGDDEITSYDLLTTPYRQTGASILSKEHHAVSLNLPAGVYHLSHDTDGQSVDSVIMVGDADDLIDAYMPDLEDVEGQTSQRAEEIQQKIDSGEFIREEVTTDANGQFDAEMHQSISTVDIIAYSHQFDGLESDASMSEIREKFASVAEQDDELPPAIQMTIEPERVNPPEEDARVEVATLDAPSFAELGPSLDALDDISEFIDLESWNDLGSWDEEELVNNIDEPEEVEELRNELESLKNENTELQNRVDELIDELDGIDSEDDLTDEELSALIDQALSERMDDFDTGDTDTDSTFYDSDGNELASPDDGTDVTTEVDVEVPLEQDMLDRDDVEEVVATYTSEDGSMETVPEENIDLEFGIVGDDEVVIEDYELPEGSEAGEIKLHVAGEDAAVSESVQVGHTDAIPSIDSVDINTMTPTPMDTVDMTVQSDDSDYRGVQDVRVFSGGQEIETDVDGSEATWSPESSGTHVVEMDVETADDKVVTETIRIEATQSSFNYPTSVRLSEGITGVTPIAADNVEEAEVDRSGDETLVTATVSDENTGKAHVYAGDVLSADEDITVQLLDADGSSLDGERTVHLYTGVVDEDAVIYRGGNAVHEDTRWGDVDIRSDSTQIQTFTDSDGRAEVSINNDPSFTERLSYRVDVWTESVSMPFF